MILSVLLRFFPFHGLNFWATLPLLIYLGMIVVIDLEHRLVLIETSLFGFILMLIYGISFHGFLGALSGALGGMVIMLGFYILGVVFGKVVGKLRHKTINEVPFGFGDVVFGIILGLLAGWSAIAAAILVGILIFGAYSLVWLIGLIITKRYQSFSNAQALTPFLILGTIILFYL
jgi:prepilin signal peptidase PulO-like enzyme (type II secretory pathway)